jgi:hypothetical protein
MHVDLLGLAARPVFAAAVLVRPDEFLFLVSTLMTGSPAARAALTAALMWWNWASRSACQLPSRVLELACKLHLLGALAARPGPAAPARRTRPAGGACPASSLIPSEIVSLATLVTAATSAVPP